jgi:hypothetical protein
VQTVVFDGTWAARPVSSQQVFLISGVTAPDEAVDGDVWVY